MPSLWRDYFQKEFNESPLRYRHGSKYTRFKKWESRHEESLDYDTVESSEWKKHAIRESNYDKGVYFSVNKKRAVFRWSLITMTGILCALFGVGIHMSTITLVNLKNDIITRYMYSGRWGVAFCWHFLIALVFSTVSFLFVYYEPAALGSGIPEIKSYLNGVQMEKVVRLRTLFAKCGSVIFTVASGLFAGPEGPMVHVGAIIGAAISKWYADVVLGGATDWTTFNSLRNDADSRDFVTYGAAAGIAAAFRAPIGGVLFILEEGASFWSTKMTWRAFFCSCITLLTVIIMDRALRIDGEDMTSNFSFGKFSEVMLVGDRYPYFLIELTLFFLMGCLGGVLGALFVHFNGILADWRKRYMLNDSRKRFIEILIISSLTAWMTFTVPLIWHVCSDMPTDMSGYTSDEKTLISRLVQFDCPANQYNQVASLFYVDSNTAIKFLFHFREHMSSHTFDTGSLLVVFLPYYILACATCGIMAAAGVFVSCLVSGAVMGRLIGHVLQQYFEEISDSGTYALVGAAAMIGGVCRNTISLTVMMVEATGNLQYVLPIMLSLLAAKYIGDMLTTGLYNRLVVLRDLPWLPESMTDMGLVNFFPVTEFMAKPVVFLRSLERVGNVYETLQSTSHNLFPILSDTGQLKGSIDRSTLCRMLQSSIFSVPLHSTDEIYKEAVTLCPVQVKPLQPPPVNSVISIDSLQVEESSLSLWMDFRRYMDPSPYVILESASVQKAFRMFRTLGLRHLIVIDSDCKVTGILSRKDLTQAQLRSHRIKKSDVQKYFPLVDQLEPHQVPSDLAYDHITIGSSSNGNLYAPSEEFGIDEAECGVENGGNNISPDIDDGTHSLNNSTRSFGKVSLMSKSFRF